MSIGNAVLSVLGLAPYVAEAEAAITATKSAVELIQSAKELLESEAGLKFRSKVEAIVAVTKEKVDGSVHIGKEEPAAAPLLNEPEQYAKGQYVFDSLNGWEWKGE